MPDLTVSSAVDTFMQAANAAGMRSALSLGSVENTALSTWSGSSALTTLGTIATGVWNGTAIPVANGGTGSTTAAGARTALGLVIGTDVQAFNSALSTLAGKSLQGSGAIVLDTSPTLTTPVLGVATGTSAALTKTALGTTSAFGLSLTNSTAAASGAQQYSPSLLLSAQGWKTTSTAASQAVDWQMFVKPVQGTTSPTSELLLETRTNGGSWNTFFSLSNASASYPYRLTLGGVEGANNAGVITSGVGGLIFGRADSAYNQVFIGYSSGYILSCSADTQLGFSANNAGNAADVRGLDAFFARDGAASIQCGADAASPTAYTLKGADARAGTDTNASGASFTISAGRGTGSGSITGATLLLKSPIAGGSGTGAQTLATGLTIIGGCAKLASYTVSTLPSASTVGAGAIAFVTDATSQTGYSVASGGGALAAVVVSDGSQWLIH